MNYQGREALKVLVVHPQVARSIAERRQKKGLPEVPISELEYGAEEVAEIVNRLGAKLLPGKRATLHGLLEILEEGWDIIWLITHGEDDGWYLYDGLVNASEMTALIRSSGVFLTVMNTCSSYEVARRAAQELGTAFICTLTEVPDRQAYVTGVLFAQKLAQGYDYATAYRLIEPGQEHPYVMIEARDLMRPERPNPRGRVNLDPDTFHRFIESVQELDQIINGHERLGVIGLKDLVKDLRTDLTAIKKQLDTIERRQQIRNIVMWSMAVGLFLLAAILILMASKQGIL